MNEPAASQTEVGEPGWTGSIALLPMAAVFVGVGGQTSEHRTLAHKVAVGVTAISAGGGLRSVSAPLVIPAGVDHTVHAAGRGVVLAYLDVRRFDLSEAERLARRWSHVTVTPGVVDALVEDVHRLPPRALDGRLLDALAALMSDETVPTAARAAGLSESRLTHLVSEQLSGSPKRWRLWLRLRSAIDLLAGGANVTEASHSAGFADSAHFSRACAATLGVPPSRLRLSRIDRG
jgi:AraC-like DNA-binding protein